MTFPFTDQGAARAPSPSGDPNLETKNQNPSSFCGDCEGLLDRMLEQCQTRVTARHPGFGRKLVPYFNTNDDDGSTANGIRHQQQKGETCGYHPPRSGQKPGPGFKRSPRSSRKTNYANSRRSKKLDSTSVGFYRFHENKGGSSSPTATMSSNSSSSYEDYTRGGVDFSPPSLCSLFAGPICFNSPPPEALPMPTAVLLAKAMCLS